MTGMEIQKFFGVQTSADGMFLISLLLFDFSNCFINIQNNTKFNKKEAEKISQLQIYTTRIELSVKLRYKSGLNFKKVVMLDLH